MALNKALSAAFAAALVAGFAFQASAQDNYPDRTIRLIVPFAAGGGTDTVARVVAAGLSEVLGQAVVVENHGGGSTMIGTQMAVSAPPDGYTLLLGSTTLSINPGLRGDELPYDTYEDLQPLSLLSVMPHVILARPGLGITTLEELLEEARERPGQLTIGSPGIASGGHLAIELFQEAADIDLLHVPYSGTAPATMDLIGERIDLQFGTIISVLPHVQAGSAVALAVTTEERSDALPDVPAAGEIVPGFQATSWNSLWVPAGTPDAIVQRLNEAINEVVYSDAVVETLSTEGAMPAANTPEQLAEWLRDETERFTEVIERAGIEAE